MFINPRSKVIMEKYSTLEKIKPLLATNLPNKHTNMLEKTRLVLIDGNVDHPQQLKEGVARGTSTIILDPNQDGVEQISKILATHTNIDSVHLVSHGWSGGLQLGNSELSLDTFEQYLSQVGTWAKKLTGASLLLYGCQVALGEQGRRFLERLCQVTGANIAASSDRVGNALKGGNWHLDVSIGQIAEELAFLPPTQQAYTGVFDPIISMIADELVLVEDELTQTTLTFTLSEPPPDGGIEVSIENNQPFGLADFQLAPFPISPIPPTTTGIDRGRLGGPAGNQILQFTVIDQTATITIAIFDDPDRTPEGNITDPDGPLRNDDQGVEDSIFTLLPGAGYEVDGSANVVALTLADTRSQLGPSGPIVSLTTTPEILFESEETVLTFNFTLSEPPPEGGVSVTVTGDVAESLTQLDLLELDTVGGDFPVGDFDFSGFDFNITSQTASIIAPIFQDGIPEDPQTVNYTLVPGNGYQVDENSNISSVIFADAPPNTPPDAVDDINSTPETDAINGNVLNNDTDIDGDTLTVTELNGQAADVGSQITLASDALLTLNSDGSYSYNPNGQFDGLEDGQTATDSFEYTIGDGQGGVDSATVTITIDGVTPNTPPDAVDDINSTPETDAINGNVLNNDTDIDGDTLTVTELNGEAADVGSQVTLASGALLTLNSDGSYSYNPNGQFDGLEDGQTATDSFEYTIGDGVAGVDSATVTITIDGVTPNTPPVAFDDSFSTGEGTTLRGNVLNNDRDVDDDTLSAILGVGPSNGTLDFKEDGSFTYTPDDGFLGMDSFTYQANHGTDDSPVATVNIEVEIIEEVVAFGSTGDDTLDAANLPDFNGIDDILFAGAGNDLAELTDAVGGNRVYGQSGDDTFFFGDNNRGFGGDGDDIFYLIGDRNILTGGGGSDQFWFALAEIPNDFDTVTDFEVDVDIIGIGGLDVGFSDLTLTQQGNDTLISSNEADLGLLLNVDSTQLDENDFAFG